MRACYALRPEGIQSRPENDDGLPSFVPEHLTNPANGSNTATRMMRDGGCLRFHYCDGATGENTPAAAV